MEQEIINFVNLSVDLSEAAYHRNNHYEFSRFWHLEPEWFKTEHFEGFISSDDQTVVLVFRGTQSNWQTLEAFSNSLGQWLTNSNFRQVNSATGRIHKGFNEELNSGFDKIKSLLRKHGVKNKFLIISGHSAGGAMAILAGDRLYRELGTSNALVCTFSAPKVGDLQFAKSYPIEHIRIEAKNDLVPFFPLHPAAYNFIGEAILFNIMNYLDYYFPRLNLRSLQNVEYYHSGHLLYMDDQNNLLYRSSDSFWGMIGNALGDLLDSIFDDQSWNFGYQNNKILPIPKEIFDFARIAKIFEEIDTTLRTGRISFYKDHGIETLSLFLKELL